MGKPHATLLAYKKAQETISQIAQRQAKHFVKDAEIVTLMQALGRVNTHDIYAPVSTPAFDTSAMDGYAVSSDETKQASKESPVVLRICGTMAAGDQPISVSGSQMVCTEIMTGAQFPSGSLDAVVPVEHAHRIDGNFVKLSRPVIKNQHRRFAGNDYHKDELVVPRSTTIKSNHIMALASLDIREVKVSRKLKIGVWSTGAEIANGMIPDCNGPYLACALQELGADVSFLGVMNDDVREFASAIDRALNDSFDLLISTGAVSAGKFDFVRNSLDDLKACIHFHHVAMRPGHPVLFASVDDIPFFGLPGNPVAAAACFRVLVVPFLKSLVGIPDSSIKAKVVSDKPITCSAPPSLDSFRHAVLCSTKNGNEVQLNVQQSPAKVKPMASSNCWVHIPMGHGDVQVGDLVNCFPLDASVGPLLC